MAYSSDIGLRFLVLGFAFGFLASVILHSLTAPTLHGISPEFKGKGSCWCSREGYCLCTPSLAIDVVIEYFSESGDFKGIVIAKRKFPPEGYALPGGFVEVGETVEETVIREVLEETHLHVEDPKFLGVFSDPKRDPRRHTASVVYTGRARGHFTFGDDTSKVEVVHPKELIQKKDQYHFAFDHRDIVEKYCEESEAKRCQ